MKGFLEKHWLWMLWHAGMGVGSYLILLKYGYSPEGDLFMKALSDVIALMQEDEMAGIVISFCTCCAWSIVSFLWLLAVNLFNCLIDKLIARNTEKHE